MRSLIFAVALVLSVPLTLAAAPRTAQAQQRRVLFIPQGSVPGRGRRTVQALISSSSVLVSYDSYVRAAREANVRPSSSRGISQVGTQQNADVIVVASYGGHYRRRTLRLRYYSGQTGELVTSSTMGLRGQHLRPAAQHAILRDLDSVAPGGGGGGGGGGGDAGGDSGGDSGGGDGGLPPPEDWGEGEAAEGGDATGDGGGDAGGGEDSGEPVPLEEQNQWGFSVALGGGIGQRSSDVPTNLGGPTNFSTIPFFALQARAMGYVRPDPASLLRVGITARYTTSIGMTVGVEGTDEPATDLRVHHLALGLRTDIPLAPGDRPTFLQLELGWQFRMLDLEMPSAFLPDYTLTGFFGRIGLWFSVGDSPISIGLIPEVGHAFKIGSFERNIAEVEDGFMIGAEAHIRLQVVRELALQLLYREAHMFLGSVLPDEQLNDAERFVILRAEYRF